MREFDRWTGPAEHDAELTICSTAATMTISAVDEEARKHALYGRPLTAQAFFKPENRAQLGKTDGSSAGRFQFRLLRRRRPTWSQRDAPGSLQPEKP
jgi:hypothetical protein